VVIDVMRCHERRNGRADDTPFNAPTDAMAGSIRSWDDDDAFSRSGRGVPRSLDGGNSLNAAGKRILIKLVSQIITAQDPAP